jgi:hypothetical protein
MNIGDAFPSKYLKASDLQGAEPVVTIDRLEIEAVGREKQQKAVLYFRGKEKGLVLNKTNANKITDLLGTALTEEWEGQRIRLFATETQFGGDMVDCIRVKAVSANGAKPKPSPPPVTDMPDDSEVPF